MIRFHDIAGEFGAKFASLKLDFDCCVTVGGRVNVPPVRWKTGTSGTMREPREPQGTVIVERAQLQQFRGGLCVVFCVSGVWRVTQCAGKRAGAHGNAILNMLH